MYDFNDDYVLGLLKEYGVLEERPDLGIVWFGLPPDGGYLVLYPDGQHHHTYHNPENWVIHDEKDSGPG